MVNGKRPPYSVTLGLQMRDADCKNSTITSKTEDKINSLVCRGSTQFTTVKLLASSTCQTGASYGSVKKFICCDNKLVQVLNR